MPVGACVGSLRCNSVVLARALLQQEAIIVRFRCRLDPFASESAHVLIEGVSAKADDLQIQSFPTLCNQFSREQPHEEAAARCGALCTGYLLGMPVEGACVRT